MISKLNTIIFIDPLGSGEPYIKEASRLGYKIISVFTLKRELIECDQATNNFLIDSDIILYSYDIEKVIQQIENLDTIYVRLFQLVSQV